jgi:hypothetical protein
MRCRYPFALLLATFTLVVSLADTGVRAQAGHAQSPGVCRPMVSPFGIKLVGCQTCSDGCTTYPGSADPSMDGEDEGPDELPGDLQLNETFAALTSSTFAVSAPNMIGDNIGGPSIPIFFPQFYRIVRRSRS